MILLAHPTGNENVRAVLAAPDQADLFSKFVTALGWSNASWLVGRLPANLHPKKRLVFNRRNRDAHIILIQNV